mgnify:CR=1 FL=1
MSSILIVWNEDSICLTAMVRCSLRERGQFCFTYDFEVGEDVADLVDRVMYQGWCEVHT